MDDIFSKNKLQVAIPILFGVIYLSAFKNGTQTCDRYFVNYFLYLLTSLAVYFYSSTELDFGISGKGVKSFLATLLIMILIVSFYRFDNIYVKHIIWFSIIVILGILAKKFHQSFDENKIKSVLKKLIIVLTVCVGIAVIFPQILKPNIEIAALFGLLIAIILRVMDTYLFDNKYNDPISYIVVFLVSLFVMYDTKRVMVFSKKCVSGKTGYLENVLDMFLNIVNIFSSLLSIGE
tara:strand:+ start:1349 stop:2053 length:705 start_codon:yes stop_codon:yes gene_type:complete